MLWPNSSQVCLEGMYDRAVSKLSIGQGLVRTASDWSKWMKVDDDAAHVEHKTG